MSPSVRVSVAAAAMRRYSSIESFREHIEPLVAGAAAAGSDLIVLPELLCVGLLWTHRDAGSTEPNAVKALYERVLNPLFTPYRDVLSGLAHGHQVIVAGASYWHQCDGRAVNTAFWCRPDGTVSCQDKLHPTRPERAIDTVGGTEVGLFDLNGIKTGMLVCYDVQFPELSRNLVDGGAEVIIVPSLTDVRGYWRVRHCAQARAVENQVFVCVSPLIGSLGIPKDRPVEGHGRSLVACPIDNRFQIEDGVLTLGNMDVEGLVHADLDIELLRLARARSEITHLKDRRPDLYVRPLKPVQAGADLPGN